MVDQSKRQGALPFSRSAKTRFPLIQMQSAGTVGGQLERGCFGPRCREERCSDPSLPAGRRWESRGRTQIEHIRGDGEPGPSLLLPWISRDHSGVFHPVPRRSTLDLHGRQDVAVCRVSDWGDREEDDIIFIHGPVQVHTFFSWAFSCCQIRYMECRGGGEGTRRRTLNAWMQKEKVQAKLVL